METSIINKSLIQASLIASVLLAGCEQLGSDHSKKDKFGSFSDQTEAYISKSKLLHTWEGNIVYTAKNFCQNDRFGGEDTTATTYTMI